MECRRNPNISLLMRDPTSLSQMGHTRKVREIFEDARDPIPLIDHLPHRFVPLPIYLISIARAAKPRNVYLSISTERTMKYAGAFLLSLLAVGAAGYTAYAAAGSQTCHSSIVMSGGVVLAQDRVCS